ncbi:MAG: hypothetical protein ACE5LS_04640 [Thermoplasmata archaeon]
MTSMAEFFLVLLALAAAAVPSQMLLGDVLGIMRAPRSLRLAGIPALVFFLALLIFLAVNHAVLLGAIGVGVAVGILATLALDSIRIPGYLTGNMPMDLPMRFGTMILGLDKRLKQRVMGRVLRHINEQIQQGVPSDQLMDEKGFPQLPLPTMRKLLKPAFRDVLEERGVPSWKVRGSGYLWHYTNGASFGIIHALLLGASWPFTVLFGLVLAGTFIVIIQFLIPPMRRGPRMPAVILLAHVAVILVFGFAFAAFLAPEASALSLLSQVLQLLGL